VIFVSERKGQGLTNARTQTANRDHADQTQHALQFCAAQGLSQDFHETDGRVIRGLLEGKMRVGIVRAGMKVECGERPIVRDETVELR